MASSPPDDNITIPSLGGNNQSHPPNVAGRYPSTFKDFDDIDKGNLLFDNAYLFGIHVNGNDGPRRSTRQIAKHKHSSLYPLITYQEKNSILTEMISTENDRNTRFVHQGWSKFAISTVTPWILSRITNNNHLAPIKDESYVTKRVTHQRLSVHVTMDALSPVPEFHASIEDALSKPTKFAKFEAIQECFAFWGDVLALEFDLGTSISITDLQENFHGLNGYAGAQDLATSKTAWMSTLGGEADDIMNGDMAWLARAVPPEQWSQVRITRVAPITALLRKETRSQITELYSTLLTYQPLTLRGPINWNNKSFESTQHALKTITSIVIRSSGFLESLDVVYLDNTRPSRHGGNGGTERAITLSNGEHITEVFVWADAEWIFAVQFVTNYRRVSPHYGGEDGIPTILRSEDGVLVALSSTWGKHPKWEVDVIQQIQTIWRHDVSQTRPDLQNSHFNYFGGSGGRPFNDLPFLESLDSAYISHIKISWGSLVDGIQVIYGGNAGGLAVNSDTPYHGGQGGGTATFQLEPDEHIVAVSGRQKDTIVQLYFVTSSGRTSPVYGGGEGTPFMCQAPTTSGGGRMRLRYIGGESARYLNGLLLVWTRV